MSGYPIQPSKVQPPPLRDETLARDRLLDWLHAKVHHRVVYVIAEAGYGKTTLLADFSRRTRLRTLWYRLDDEDQAWASFMSHLVAAGCELDPEFAPATRGLLRELATAAPTLEAVLETFVRELQALDQGAVLILDDYHAVDEAPDVRLIMRELLARAPERVAFVIASRRLPSLPVARLRSQGEVAELGTDDLRFNEAETERLFRETYGRPLDPDVLTDLSRRTEGWAASLQLVQAAIRHRSAAEVRSFVRSISGAEGDLYDYLAEEVIGTLPVELQAFLVRIAILEDLDPQLVEIASGTTKADGLILLAAGERAGLLSRAGGGRGRRVFHPLVRDFLLDKLRREFDPVALADLHRAVATARGVSWKVACHHLAQASDGPGVHAILEASVKEILGGGDFALAARYLRQFPLTAASAAASMILSRAEIQVGHPETAVALAEEAFQLAPSALTAVNLGSVLTVTGDLHRAADLLRVSDHADFDAITAEIATALTDLVRLSLDGPLGPFISHVEAMAHRQSETGLIHYAGISWLNGATALRAQGEARRCLEFSRLAIDALTASTAASEVVSAKLARDWALAHLGEPSEPVDLMADTAALSLDTRAEALTEAAQIETWYGDADEASRLLSLVDPTRLGRRDMVDLHQVARLELALRQRAYEQADVLASRLPTEELSSEPGHKAHQLAVKAWWAIATNRSDAERLLRDAASLAEVQGARFWHTYAQLLACATAKARHVTLPPATRSDTAYLSVLAELIVDLLPKLAQEDVDAVKEEARRRPNRWRHALRAAIEAPRGASKWSAAEVLDEVGDASDVRLLRQVSRSAKPGTPARSLGRPLARRLAQRVFVEDQGRIHLLIGRHRVEGASLRRKVLSLLAFLLTRAGFSATRDEVLDALWPDIEPEIAVNSLNQTVYFLRRVFEPEYVEQLSPGFVHFDSNVVWLDGELVDSRSAGCWRQIEGLGSSPRPEQVLALAELYRGRFALDFAYEEWAIPYRDSLHAAFLHAVEASVAADTASGHFDRGIRLARAALAVDPLADGLELSLVRLYRLAGAHAAAAEQYAHYAAVLRDELGVEAPRLDAL